MADFPFNNLQQTATSIQQGELSPVELTGAILARIAQINPQLNAYRLVMEGFADGDPSAYDEAEAKLDAANALIPVINARLCEVDVALGDRDDCTVLG